MHLQCALCHPFQTCYTLTCRGPTSALRKHLRTKHPEALTEIEEAALTLPPSSPERVNVEAPLGSLSPDENWQRHQDVQSKQGSLLDLGSDLWNLVAGATSAAEDTSNGESCPTSPSIWVVGCKLLASCHRNRFEGAYVEGTEIRRGIRLEHRTLRCRSGC